jgi:hypothetical protein
MSESSNQPSKPGEHGQRMIGQEIRNFVVEIGIYAILLIVYFYLVLEFLAAPLANLFESSLGVYAFTSLGLIVAQGVLLDSVVHFIIDFFQLNKKRP